MCRKGSGNDSKNIIAVICCHLLPYESAEGGEGPPENDVHLSTCPAEGLCGMRGAERSRGRPGEKSIKTGAVFIGSWWKEALCLLQLQLQHTVLHHNLDVLYQAVVIDILLL